MTLCSGFFVWPIMYFNAQTPTEPNIHEIRNSNYISKMLKMCCKYKKNRNLVKYFAASSIYELLLFRGWIKIEIVFAMVFREYRLANAPVQTIEILERFKIGIRSDSVRLDSIRTRNGDSIQCESTRYSDAESTSGRRQSAAANRMTNPPEHSNQFP